MANILTACILNGDDNRQLYTAGSQAGLSKGFIQYNKDKSAKKARLISEGDERGFESIEADKTRSKLSEAQVSRFEQWIIKDCKLVIQNPLKNDVIIQKDRKGKVVYGNDNQPLKIKKMILMSSYRELHLYMIDNYRDMKMDDGKVLFSECTLRKIMPRHIKKAGDRYKQMCGCQVCIIFKDMYSCLRPWRKKFISRLQTKIGAMQQCSRNRSSKQDILDEYKSKVMHNNTIVPERAWNAVAELACPKVDIKMTTVLDRFTSLDA
jgi:hypothetical protein